MEKVKFKFDNGEITYALRMRLGQIGETDFEERGIPGQTRFLVYFDRGTEKEERWWIPKTSLVPVGPMPKYEEIYITVEHKQPETIRVLELDDDENVIASVTVYLSPQAIEKWEGQIDLNQIIFHANHLINHEYRTKFPLSPPGGGKVQV